MSADPWMSGIVEQDGAEARAADRFDRADYRKVAGRMYDADRVPDRADVEDGAW